MNRAYRLFLTLLLTWAMPAFAESIVIAHRGASGYLPEHTLAAYQKAIEMGADYIEPDLVITKDGVLVARHEHYLGLTTDVASKPEFANRKRRIEDQDDWFSEDFTLAEIKTLRTRQAFPGRDLSYDGRFDIPTLQEVIDLVAAESKKRGRVIGIYPETKVPGHFKSLGFDFPGLLLGMLEANGLNQKGAAVYIQSFEPEILRELRDRTELPLVQLVTPAADSEPGTPNIPLDDIATFADGVGAMKWLLISPQREDTGFLRQAQSRGLFVHIWTLRDDAFPETVFPDAETEVRHYLSMGIDGFFTDFPDSGVRLRDEAITAGVP